jgi:hypothetical protein
MAMKTNTWLSLQLLPIAFLTMLVLPGRAQAQPNVTSFSFSPTAINTSTSSANVTLNFTLTDASSGIFYLESGFVDPSGGIVQRTFKVFSPPSTSITDSAVVTFPQFSPQGTWNVAYIFLADSAGNTLFLDSAGVAARGFPTALLVSSAVDNTPPNISALSITPASIDTTAASANVNVNFTVSDDLSGADFFQVVLLAPSGNTSQVGTATFAAATSKTGSAAITFPRFSEAGTWTVTSVFVADAAGNTLLLDSTGLAARGLTPTLSVTSTTDNTAPLLTAFTFAPTSINVTGAAATVTSTFTATDDIAGVTNVQVAFLSQSGGSTQNATATFTANTSVSGTATATFPRGSENGTWTVQFVFLTDAAGNTRTLATTDLANAGFPTQLTVINATGDTTPPVIVPTVSPTPGVGGWITTAPVTVSWSVTDPESGITSSSGCGTATLSAETAGTTFTCSAVDGAGLTSSASVVVKIDLTPPVVTPVVNPAPNAAGWDKTAVTVSWTLSDPVSGVSTELSSGCDPVTLSAETAGTVVTCTGVNNAGLARSVSVTVKIDMTLPTAAAVATPAPNGAGWNNTNVTVTFTGADALSGIAFCTAPVVLSTEGTGLSATGTCTDNAGNVSVPVSVTGINIDKTAPVTSNVAATPNPLEIGNSTTITATITDSGGSNVASAQYNIDGGSFIAMSGTFGGSTANVSATTAVFTAPGVHNICVVGTDIAGNVGTAQCILFAAYDPNGGFVTGGGGANSPAGADVNNPSGSGPITFAFDLKYLPNNQTVPSGDLEFHYNAGNIVFKSTGWDFLVVTNGNRAQAQGTGTINGTTSCKFSVDAWDSSFQPGNVDAFGLTIYNCAGGSGNRYNLVTAPTTNGNIKVHQ